jgi:type I site-specific restriction-modification system R (restriction) subunit
MANQPANLKIGLLDNSHHSLKRGYEMWSQWKRTEDAWLLKESIIWVHHGIELALKQLLAQTNAFLVFEDVNKAVKSLANLREKKGMEKAGVLDLFDNDDTVMSVGFKNLVERAAVALSIPELTKNASLRRNIDELTKYRNKVVHFSIELDAAAVSNLLSDILDPLLSMLKREVIDENFKTNRIPEIRETAQPVQKFSEQIRREIVDKAIQATINAMPPKGNRRAGIVWQTIGTGLETTIVDYLMRARLLPRLRDNHAIVLTDRLDLVTQLYHHISETPSQDNTVKIVFPESRIALAQALETDAPKIIVSTMQKFDPSITKIDKECLLVAYNSYLPPEIQATFPNAIHTLFTNFPPQHDANMMSSYGALVSKYDFRQAVNDGVVKPVRIENRKVTGKGEPSSSASEYSELYPPTTFWSLIKSGDFINQLAKDIAQHFKSRQKNFVGKGLIVVSDIETGIALSKAIADIEGDAVSSDSVRTISSMVSPAQRAVLLERFQKREDSLSLLIATGSFFQGFDNPLIHTIYVTSPVSLQLRYHLAGILSRPYKGKQDVLIVDYVGLDWNLEDLL